MSGGWGFFYPLSTIHQARTTMPHMPGSRLSIKGSAGLVVAFGTVVALLILLPAYRIFFAISLAIAAIVVVILRLWHKLRPVHLEEADDKRPLKLS